MKVERIPFDSILSLSKRDKDYQIRSNIFSDFIRFSPDNEGLMQAIDERKNFPVDRSLLVDVIKRQYDGTKLSITQADHIEALLNEQTFTVITAHQPSLMTGPMFYVTKIFSTIVLAKRLSKPGHHIVPVFINGSEDHDFNEVNNFSIFNKQIAWDTDQGGPVGRFSLEGFNEVLEQFLSILGESEKALSIGQRLKRALQKAENYNQFVFNLINEFFGQYGIIVVNTDEPLLKKAFSKYMLKELEEQPSKSLVEATQNTLEQRGYKPQAYPREINLFYLLPGKRERIVFENGQFKVLNTDLVFTVEDMRDELKKSPENFSPNVVMRPLYQEVIFPNIAYIGGGGELAYWLERKNQFEFFGVFYPALIRRNSTMIIQKSHLKALNKLELEWTDLLLEQHETINGFLQKKSQSDLSLSSESELIKSTFAAIAEKAKSIDPTLIDAVEVEKIKALKIVEQLESRLTRSVKKVEEININQINSLYAKLFPSGGLQERNDNFFQYYLSYGEELLELFNKHLDPLDKEFLVFIEE
jgi:bacillithiol biosynthesis cysteine-adding enzyme BshC